MKSHSFEAGDRVLHLAFGEGTIYKVWDDMLLAVFDGDPRLGYKETFYNKQKYPDPQTLDIDDLGLVIRDKEK